MVFSVPSAARFKSSSALRTCALSRRLRSAASFSRCCARCVSSICSSSIGCSSRLEPVDAHDHLLARLHLALVSVAGLRDLGLREAALRWPESCRPSRRCGGCSRWPPLPCRSVRLLQEVAAAQRIGHRGHAALVGDHLLRAQRDGDRVLARQRVGFIQRIGVQRLRPAQHRRQRLQRRAHDVVVRLLPGQRAARRLRVEAQLPSCARLARRSGRASPAPRSCAPPGTWRSPRRSRCAR